MLIPIGAGLAVWPTIGVAPTSGTLTVAVVQGNAPDIGLDLLGARDTIRSNHLAESRRLLDAIADDQVPQPDLLVWPETATAISGPDPVLDDLVADFGAPALIGALYYVPGGGAENAVVTWDPETGAGERYTKQELVPFAEYVPLRSIARWFTPFVEDTADMRSGTRAGVLEVGGITVGVAICYEAAYDYIAREAVAAGAQLLVVPTNNAWYGPGEMSHQQLAMSRLRAVELGRAAVVAATSGVSAIVRPDGSLARSTDLFTAESLVETVPLRDETTIAARLGGWPEWILVGVGVVTLVLTVGFRFRGRIEGRDRAGREDVGR
ncbi:MAG: apolipoprotein N-acyltransferase [Pseudonocardiaceae bacterium]